MSNAQHTVSETGVPPMPPAARTPLIFATNNAHKVEEIQSAIGNLLEVISLRQAGIDIEIPEPYDTLEANASEKSATIHRLTGKNCFSEDSGLEVDALDGAPGVKSARYAGEGRSTQDNIQLLLDNLAAAQTASALQADPRMLTASGLHPAPGVHKDAGIPSAPDRRARFRTVISLILDGKEHLFTGVCEGRILDHPTGAAGFGYDPVFAPEGSSRSFAEMTLEEKNLVSHRRKAADQLVEFLRRPAPSTQQPTYT